MVTGGAGHRCSRRPGSRAIGSNLRAGDNVGRCVRSFLSSVRRKCAPGCRCGGATTAAVPNRQLQARASLEPVTKIEVPGLSNVKRYQPRFRGRGNSPTDFSDEPKLVAPEIAVLEEIVSLLPNRIRHGLWIRGRPVCRYQLFA